MEDEVFEFEENARSEPPEDVGSRNQSIFGTERRSENQRRKDYEVLSEFARAISSLPSLSLSFSQSGKALIDRQYERIFTDCLKALFVDGGILLDKLKKKKQSSICGAIWKKGKMAYRCRDCQVTPNSCICVDCFIAGNHEGHDYILHQSTGGGCCDCGDSTAWNPKGFCSHHSGIQSHADIVASSPVFSSFQTGSPLSSSPAFSSFPVQLSSKSIQLSSPSRDIIRLLMEFLALHLDALLEDRRGSKYFCYGKAERIALWAHEACTFGDNVRRIFCEVVASTMVPRDATFAHLFERPFSLCDFVENSTLCHAPSGPMLPLIDLLLRGACFILQNKAGESVLNFVLELLHDPVFKILFAKVYVEKYGELLMVALAITEEKKMKAVESAIATIGVQLFTSPELTYVLVKENKYLELLLQSIQMLFFQISSADDQGNLVVDCKNDLVQRGGCHRFFSDLSTILKFPSVSAYMLFEHPYLFEMLLQITICLHAMNPNTRRLLDHVEYEPDDWRYSFSLEQKVSVLWPSVVEGILYHTNAVVRKEGSSVFFDTEVVSALQVLMAIIMGLKEREPDFKLNSKSVFQYGDLDFGSYSVAACPVSFHIPLHRLLAAFMQKAISIEREGSLRELIQLDKKDLLFLMSNPLRVRALMAQVHAGMWRRNGEMTMSGQLHVYTRPLYSLDALAYDVLLLQVCAILLDAPSFLLSVLDHFGIGDWFCYPKVEDNAEDESVSVVLVERFLHLVLTIVFNRHFAGNEDAFRSHVLHWLCVEKQTFSHLVARLNFETQQSNTTKVFERHLAELASRKSTLDCTGHRETAGYTLHSQYWSEFDPTFLFYDQLHLQKVFENRASMIALQKGGEFVLPMRPPSAIPPFPMLSALPKVLFCAFFQKLVFFILYNAVVKSPKYSDKILDVTIYLLFLLAQLPVPDEAKAEGERCKEADPAGASTDDVYFPSGWDFFVNCRHEVATPDGKMWCILSLLHSLLSREDIKPRHPSIRHALTLVKERSAECRAFMEDLEKTKVKVSESKGEEIAKRKAAIMGRFAVMQKQFDAKMFDLSDEDDDSSDSDGEMDHDGKEELKEGKMEEEDESKGGSASHSPGSGHSSVTIFKCELCKEEGSNSASQKPLGLVGLLTRSNVLPIVGRKSRYNFENNSFATFVKSFSFTADTASRDMSDGLSSSSTSSAFVGKGKEKVKMTPSSAQPFGIEPPGSVEDRETESLLNSFAENMFESMMGLAASGLGEEDMVLSRRQALTMLLSVLSRQGPRGGEAEEHESSDEDDVDFVNVMADEMVVHGHGFGDEYDEPMDVSLSNPPDHTSPMHLDSVSETVVLPKLSIKIQMLLSRSISTAPGVHAQSCGHTVHFDCLNSYVSSRSNRFMDVDDLLMDQKAREFWCPVCRRLSNVLIPVINTRPSASGSSKVENPYIHTSVAEGRVTASEIHDNVDWLSRELWDVSRWMKGAGKWGGIPPPISGDSQAVAGLLNNFYQKMMLIQTRKKYKGMPKSGAKVAATLLNCLSYTLMSLEVHGRLRTKESDLLVRNQQVSQYNFIQKYSQSLFCAVRYAFPDDPLFGPSAASILMNTIGWFITGKADLSSNKESAEISSHRTFSSSRERRPRHFDLLPSCLMSMDIFVLLVRWVLCSQESSLSVAFLSAVKVCYLAAVTQSVLFLALSRPSFDSSSSSRYYSLRSGSFGGIDGGKADKDDSLPSPPKAPTTSSGKISLEDIVVFVKQHFASRIGTSVDAEVEVLTLPFLRCAYLFYKLCVAAEQSEEMLLSDTDFHSQFVFFLTELHLPPLSSLVVGHSIAVDPPKQPDSLFGHQLLSDIIGRWVVVYKETHAEGGSVFSPPSFCSPYERFRLIDLPPLYQDLYHRYMNTVCGECKSVPEDSSICLLCGKFLCFKSQCCSHESQGETFRHAIKCGAGSCAFLCLRTSGVYFVRDGRCSLWGSPYLDNHGEEDVLLDRGRPLYFDPTSYLLMTNAYLSHTLDDVIMQNVDGPSYKKPRPSHQL